MAFLNLVRLVLSRHVVGPDTDVSFKYGSV